MTLALIALIVGFVGGVVGTGALAHNYPFIFVKPKTYLWKLWDKVRKQVNEAEDDVRQDLSDLLHQIGDAINKIDLVK